MNSPRILVAGIGNIFFGDDGFGVETVHALMRESLPAAVTVGDFGIRSYDLAYALADRYDAVVFVDAIADGQRPGTLCLLELDPPEADSSVGVNGHSLHPAAVLRLAAAQGASFGRLYLVGCEPAVLETEEGEIGLSQPVRAAVGPAVGMIRSLIAQLLSEKGNHHACLGHMSDRDRRTAADLADPDGAGIPALPAHA